MSTTINNKTAVIITSLFLSACSQNGFNFAKNANTQDSTRSIVSHNYNVTLGSLTNEVDILFIVDNSGSMSEEQQNMGQRFPNFIASLINYNWKIGITTTDIGKEQGRLIPLKLPAGQSAAYVLSANTANADTVFRDSVQIGANGSGDERGINAGNLAVTSNDSMNFFRPQAHLAMILISDEDERSTGANLQAGDMPQNLINAVKTKWGTEKSFAFHSIVVRPGDQACLPPNGTGFYEGFTYAGLTQLTGGFLGDVCAVDYSSQLANIGQVIQSQTQTIDLRCVPVEGSGHASLINPPPYVVNMTWIDNKLRFDPPPPAGTQVQLSYSCWQ